MRQANTTTSRRQEQVYFRASNAVVVQDTHIRREAVLEVLELS
jgi:hypothetical protein